MDSKSLVARTIFENEMIHVKRADVLGLYHVFILRMKPRSFIDADEAENYILQKTGYAVALSAVV